VKEKMKHVNYIDASLKEPEEEGAKAMRIRWLITKEDGAKNFAMRLFEVETGGYTPGISMTGSMKSLF